MEDPDSSASLPVVKDSPVTASLGPVGPLLRQLSSQTTPPDVITKDEIQSLTEELNGLCISLMHHSEAEEPSSTAKCWMSEVRELCYDTKNYFDDAQFISKQDHDALSPEEKQENARFEFEILVARAEHAKARRDRYGIDKEGIKKPKLPSIRRRLPVLCPELIDDGRVYQRMLDNLLRTSTKEKQLKVISLVGLEGVGKTTLAKRLYHQQQIGERFPCRAFVRVSPNPDMIKILTSIFTQIKGQQPDCYLDAQDLVTNIKTHLQDKRYLIIIDDLWSTSVWDIIMRVFPDDGCHSRIITTTQFEDVATACCSYQSKYIFEMEPLEDDQSRKLFFSMVVCFEEKVYFPDDFNGVLSDIIMKCGGLPLSVVNIASLLPTSSEPNLQLWMEDIRDSLPSTLRTNPTSVGIKEVINLIYNNLSPQLKTCLLYLVVYPEGYTVNTDDLVKQWVIEGFIGDGESKYEIAGGYFDELVSRGMIQAVDINYSQVLSCTLHHTVYDLIVKKSIEENFIIMVDNFQSPIGLPDKVRRLSVQFGGARSACVPTGIIVSEVRSLAFFGFYGCTDIIEECKLLRVLILHVWADQVKVTDGLSGISKLSALRYLKIACNVEIELAAKIQDLQFLETLEVDMPLVAIPSEIGGLRRLSTLKIAVGEISNEDIFILQALPVLSVLALNVRTNPVEMIIFNNWGFLVLKYFEFRCPMPWLKFEAGSMTALRNLDLCFNAHEADQEDRTEIINIEHLPGLKEITAHIWGANNFRNAIFDNHPSNPRIEVLVDRIFNGDTTSMGKRAKKYVSNDEGKVEDEKKQPADSRLERMSTLKGVPMVKGSSSLVPMEASVAQLVGTVGRLISKIIDAARTARQNKWECEDLTARLSTIGDVLPRLPQDAKVERPLRELGSTLGEAHELVLACQSGSSVGQLIGARHHAESLKQVNTRIDSHIGLLNLVFTTAGRMDQARPPNHTVTATVPSPGGSSGLAAPVRLTWAEIAAATNYFADKLSRRSSEVLYKGRLRDGPEVAVKVLSKNGRQDDVDGAMVAEVEILFPLHHPHILPLVGWCSEEEDRILVYHHEHMSNGTLRDHVLRLHRRVRVRVRMRGSSTFSSSPVRLTWKARVKVLLGASRAIEHLHRCGVIHRNVTSFNILLDGSWAPRLSGFGQAILLAAAGDQVLVPEVVGTPGYIDPEYSRDGSVSAANDVYSFGVVILETLTGEDPATMQMDSVLLAIRDRKLRNVLVRRPTATPRQLEALELVAHTAECCLFPHGNDRPAMPNVVANLERALTIINT